MKKISEMMISGGYVLLFFTTSLNVLKTVNSFYQTDTGGQYPEETIEYLRKKRAHQVVLLFLTIFFV